MIEAKHTPGPWRAVSNSFGSQFVYGSVERVSPTGVKYNDLICGGDNPSLLTEDNARLIAAAPDMLEALQAAVSPDCIGGTALAQQFFRDNEASRAAIKYIKAAIAKATGA